MEYGKILGTDVLVKLTMPTPKDGKAAEFGVLFREGFGDGVDIDRCDGHQLKIRVKCQRGDLPGAIADKARRVLLSIIDEHPEIFVNSGG